MADLPAEKLVCLHQLPQLTTDVVCVVKDMHTVSITYKLGISNLEFTVGLTENTDVAGNRINNWLIPRTLRINDKAVETSADAQFIDMIFSKTHRMHCTAQYAMQIKMCLCLTRFCRCWMMP